MLTRDIISPIKSCVEGLSDLIKEIENEQMEKQLYPLVPKEFLHEIRMFIESEFENGAVSEEFQEAKLNIRARYYAKHIAGINFGEIFADF